MRRVHLDWQAGTPVLPEVFEAMRPFFTESFGNPSSPHQLGREARDAVEAARAQLAAFVNAASPEEILFTSGGTEAANLAVIGTAFAAKRRGDHLVVSATEHPAVLQAAEFLEGQGFSCTRIPVDGEGMVDPAAVSAAITDRTVLVGIHHANHDLGALQPVAEIGALCQERGVPLFVDATASGGWLPIDAQALGASLLSLAPHRFHGPKGVGVLWRHRRARIANILHGGQQEGGKRPGTENVPAIVGAGVAAEAAARDLPQRAAHAAQLQRLLLDELSERIPHLRLNGPEPGPRRHPASLNLSVEFIEGEGLALLCAARGVAIASGPSCVAKAQRVPPALAAIGQPPALAQGNILLSLGHANTAEEILHAAQVIAGAVEHLRSMSAAWDEFRAGRLPALTPERRGFGAI